MAVALRDDERGFCQAVGDAVGKNMAMMMMMMMGSVGAGEGRGILGVEGAELAPFGLGLEVGRAQAKAHCSAEGGTVDFRHENDNRVDGGGV